MNINWYPGHMVKAQNDIKSSLKLIDIIVEVLDARIPKSSQNPNIDKFSEGKARIVVLNKYDLADREATERWKKYFEEKNISVITANASTGENIKKLVDTIKQIGRKIYDEKYKNKQIKVEPIYRVLIAGIPNVGKSTIINKIANRNSANVGNKPGVTKKNQWIRVADNIDLLDTPGLLWPRFENESVGINLALTGNIKQDVLDVEELAVAGVKVLLQKDKYKKILLEKYKIDNKDMTFEDDELPLEYNVLELIGKRRGCLVSGGNVDMIKAANAFLEDFKSGKIGNITLE